MWSKSIFNHKTEFLFSLSFGLVVTAIIWLTLLSREPGIRHIYCIPFYSWFQVIRGNRQWVLENIGNILMFVPFGFLVYMIIGDRKKSICSGFCFSLFIEAVQLFTRVGSFEVDDLIHNTLGCFVGVMLCRKLNISKFEFKKVWRYCARVTVAILVLSISCKVIVDFSYHQKMIDYAALSDLDGKKNLLILNGKDGYTWNSDVFVKYLDDGSLSIKGKTDSRSWYPIGNITLDAGTYVFSGLSGVKEKTVAIELAYRNLEYKYVRLIEDVGPVAFIRFTLERRTIIRAYVGVYPGCDCDVIARPVIYKEGD